MILSWGGFCKKIPQLKDLASLYQVYKEHGLSTQLAINVLFAAAPQAKPIAKELKPVAAYAANAATIAYNAMQKKKRKK